MPPTPLPITLILICVGAEPVRASRSASVEPCTSALTTRLSVCCLRPGPSAPDVFHAVACCFTRRVSRRLASRCCATSLARRSSATTMKSSPAFGHAGKTEHLPPESTARPRDLRAGFVEHRAHAAVLDAANQEVALVQRALLHQHGRDRAAALVEAGFDHHAGGATVGDGLELQHFGLQQNRVEQRVDAHSGLGRHRHHHHFAAEVLGHHFVLDELLLDAFRIGVVLVDLVDRHDQRHLGGTRVLDRLDRLRHHAVVGRHHQHDDVGELGAARTHLR
jgi:hypothetical protein